MGIRRGRGGDGGGGSKQYINSALGPFGRFGMANGPGWLNFFFCFEACIHNLYGVLYRSKISSHTLV